MKEFLFIRGTIHSLNNSASPVAYLLGGQGGQAAPPDESQANKKKKITMDKKK